MMSDFTQEQSDDMSAAIQDQFTKYAEHESDRGMITQFVLITEVIGDDGEYYLKTMRSKGSATWRALGLVESYGNDLRSIMLEVAE